MVTVVEGDLRLGFWRKPHVAMGALLVAGAGFGARLLRVGGRRVTPESMHRTSQLEKLGPAKPSNRLLDVHLKPLGRPRDRLRAATQLRRRLLHHRPDRHVRMGVLAVGEQFNEVLGITGEQSAELKTGHDQFFSFSHTDAWRYRILGQFRSRFTFGVSRSYAGGVDESREIQRTVVTWRIAIVLITLATFWPVLACSFGGWDDDLNVTGNPWMNPPSLTGIARYWRAPAADLYVPVTYTVWSAVAAIAPRDAEGRLSAWMFHAVNLIAHVAAVVCAFEILKACARAAKPRTAVAAAGIGTLLFALHPVQVETVAWVAGLKDVLAGALALAGIAVFVRPGSRSIGRSIAATVLFALALLAKPSAVVAPAIALLIDALIIKRPLRQSALTLLPSFALAIAGILLTSRAQPATWIAVPAGKRFLVAGDVITFYLWKLAWPLKLGVDYGRTPLVVLARSSTWFMGLAPAMLLVLAVWWWRRRGDGMPLAALAVFIVGVSPVLGLIPFDFQAYSTVADHYLYLAMLGLGLFALWLVERYPTRPTWAASSILLLTCAVLSFRQVWTWRDALSIAQQTTRVNPRSFSWHNRAAKSLLYEHGDAEGALVSARKAVEVNPSYGIGWQDLGLILATLNRPAEAADAYRHATQCEQQNVPAHIGLAVALADLGKSDDAIAEYRTALELDPRNLVAITNLAGVLANTGKLDEAIERYRSALAIDGGYVPARMGLARAIQQRANRR